MHFDQHRQFVAFAEIFLVFLLLVTLFRYLSTIQDVVLLFIFVVVHPKVFVTEAKFGMNLCLVPEYLLVESISARPFVDYQAAIVFCAIHEGLFKELEGVKHASIVVIELLAVGPDHLFAHENIVDVGTQLGRDTHGVLQSDDESDAGMATIHENSVDSVVVLPFAGLCQAVVKNNERVRIDLFGRVFVCILCNFELATQKTN